MRQGVVLPETPRDRRNLEGLVEDVRESPLRGREVALRLRNFRPDAGSYLASLGGPLPYMARLREIDRLTAQHEEALAEARETCDERAWLERVHAWDFGEVNDLIERHNRWYPAEARLPMDPTTGDYALVNGRSYRRRPLDASWALERRPGLPNVSPQEPRGLRGETGRSRAA
jgi:hypothetical protein